MGWDCSRSTEQMRSARPGNCAGQARRAAPMRFGPVGRAVRRGFTLVEVLVALTIVSVALMAALRAVGSLAQGSADLRARTLAQWSAENRLSQMRVQSEFPNVGRNRYDCSQGGVELACQQDVFATPNAAFRRVELSVFDARDGRRLARLVGFATTLP
jgi:general secretion pathway protein I